MDKKEFYEESQMTYAQLVGFLKSKYGKAKCDYFADKGCTRKGDNISRTAEGLFCHHVDEDKAIMLGNPDYAKMNPFKYQKADRLVYCNLLEHLLLHVKITEEPLSKKANKFELLGIGGAVILCKQISDYYETREPAYKWMAPACEVIDENYDEYISIVRHLAEVIKVKPAYKQYSEIDGVWQRVIGTQLEELDKILKK